MAIWSQLHNILNRLKRLFIDCVVRSVNSNASYHGTVYFYYLICAHSTIIIIISKSMIYDAILIIKQSFNAIKETHDENKLKIDKTREYHYHMHCVSIEHIVIPILLAIDVKYLLPAKLFKYYNHSCETNFKDINGKHELSMRMCHYSRTCKFKSSMSTCTIHFGNSHIYYFTQ